MQRVSGRPGLVGVRRSAEPAPTLLNVETMSGPVAEQRPGPANAAIYPPRVELTTPAGVMLPTGIMDKKRSELGLGLWRRSDTVYLDSPTATNAPQ